MMPLNLKTSGVHGVCGPDPAWRGLHAPHTVKVRSHQKQSDCSVTFTDEVTVTSERIPLPATRAELES